MITNVYFLPTCFKTNIQHLNSMIIMITNVYFLPTCFKTNIQHLNSMIIMITNVYFPPTCFKTIIQHLNSMIIIMITNVYFPPTCFNNNRTTCAPYPCLPVELRATLVLDDVERQVDVEVVGSGPCLQDDAVLTQVQAHAAAHLLFTEQGTDF